MIKSFDSALYVQEDIWEDVLSESYGRLERSNEHLFYIPHATTVVNVALDYLPCLVDRFRIDEEDTPDHLAISTSD